MKKNTVPAGEEPYVPDEIDEWEWLVEYLQEPGRLSAAVVPGQREGDALLARLRAELGEEALLVADDDILPIATRYLAAEAGAQGKLLVLALDGRRKFPDAREQRRFWTASTTGARIWPWETTGRCSCSTRKGTST